MMSLITLLAEDEPDDVILFKRALKARNVSVELQVTRDGQETIDYLLGKGRYSDRGLYPLPEILFLDIKMPKKSGFEVLEFLQAKSFDRPFPVVVVTSSILQQDIKRAYELGASTYLTKPVEGKDLVDLFRGMKTNETVGC